jgi:hypothetical protein
LQLVREVVRQCAGFLLAARRFALLVAQGLRDDLVAQALVFLRVRVNANEQRLHNIGGQFEKMERSGLALVLHVASDDGRANEIGKVGDDTHVILHAVTNGLA